jgi:hypothetical protein
MDTVMEDTMIPGTPVGAGADTMEDTTVDITRTTVAPTGEDTVMDTGMAGTMDPVITTGMADLITGTIMDTQDQPMHHMAGPRVPSIPIPNTGAVQELHNPPIKELPVSQLR